MVLKTPRFGQIEYGESDVVKFEDGLIGFPQYQNFLIVNHKEESVFRWLQSIEEPDLAMPIVSPTAFVTDYRPEVKLSQVKGLELSEDTPRIIYTTVTIPHGKPEEMTLNLAGPIIINAVTQQAKQVVLEDESYSIRHKIMIQKKGKKDSKTVA